MHSGGSNACSAPDGKKRGGTISVSPTPYAATGRLEKMRRYSDGVVPNCSLKF